MFSNKTTYKVTYNKSSHIQTHFVYTAATHLLNMPAHHTFALPNSCIVTPYTHWIFIFLIVYVPTFIITLPIHQPFNSFWVYGTLQSVGSYTSFPWIVHVLSVNVESIKFWQQPVTRKSKSYSIPVCFPVYTMKSEIYPLSQSHRTNSFIPNQWRFSGISCLKLRRLLYFIGLSYTHNSWNGLNLVLKDEWTGLIFCSLSSSTALVLSVKCRHRNFWRKRSRVINFPNIFCSYASSFDQ